MTVSAEQMERAQSIVTKYTVLATGTGAIPLPTASAALLGETAIMIGHLRAVFGCPIELATILEARGAIMAINSLSKALFIDVARALGWGTGNPWAAAALSGFGAMTAGIQTYIIGQLTIEIGKNGGKSITQAVAEKIVAEATQFYKNNQHIFSGWSRSRAS